METLRTQFRYNTRILLMNSYWLLIIPLVASQLVIFWHMAMLSLSKPGLVASTCELVIPILAAFLCAHTVAPEHRHRVAEITFVRPVSVLRTVLLRLVALYAIVIVLAGVMLFVYRAGLKQHFDLRLVLLAGIPSTLFLSMLALAFAAAWRTPAAGIGAALAYWAADSIRGAALNPLFSLHGYAAALDRAAAEGPVSTEWMLSKAVLLCFAAIAAWSAVRGLSRPASPTRWRAGLRVAVGVVICAVIYLCSGAAWQFSQARKAEQAKPKEACATYVHAFEGYGAIPVVYLFGPAFAAYVGYPVREIGGPDDAIPSRQATLARLKTLVNRWPRSPWADHALYEVIRLSGTAQGDTGNDLLANKLSLAYCRQFLDAYATSPFAPLVAARMVALAGKLHEDATMMWAYKRITGVYGKSEAAAEAAAQMRAYYLARGDIPRAVECARFAASLAPPEAKPEALLSLADFLAGLGRKDEARGIYAQVQQAVQAELVARGLSLMNPEAFNEDKMKQRAEIMKLRSRARQGLAALDAPPPPAAK